MPTSENNTASPAAPVPTRRCGAAPGAAEEMFRRVLSGWASDLMRLRAVGLDRPRPFVVAGGEHVVLPGRSPVAAGTAFAVPSGDAPRWRKRAA